MRRTEVFRHHQSRGTARHSQKENRRSGSSLASRRSYRKLYGRIEWGGGGGDDTPRNGVPIGNLTSQLFANVYMNELDQFIKHGLRVKHYMRYTDDFVIVSGDRSYLESLIPEIGTFLEERLHLSLHPDKVFIRTYRQGIDFLGYVVLPGHIALRRKTKQRIIRKLRKRAAEFRTGNTSETTVLSSFNSYLGVLSHADAYRLTEEIKNDFWFRTRGV
ncbi:MAG: RNA-directed DNA polymerase [bacterium]